MSHFIEVENLKKYFKTNGGMLHAVDDVSFFIKKGETLGLVGESGCGKSTLGRVIIRLLEKTDGKVLFDGTDLSSLNEEQMIQMRKRVQIVFQDPYSSLNPRLSVRELISEAFIINKTFTNNAAMEKRVLELMDIVGLARRYVNTYPHQLDGGRRQRIGIARSLALDPEFIVLDEPVSALDVCIQAQILNLLNNLKKQFHYTYLFISHNLSVVKHVSDRIAVMYLGKMVELCDFRTMFKNPMHPYTQALLSAIPIPKAHGKKERILLEGDVPSPVAPPPGCRFAGRCRYCKDLCRSETPMLRDLGGEHFVACHFAEEIAQTRTGA